MIAADTSTWIAFLQGDPGHARPSEDTSLLDRALEDRQVVMVPVVLTELLSDPSLPLDITETLVDVPMIDLYPGYWQRAGLLRAKVLAKRRKARLGDALIAQSCIDQRIRLLTRDDDFRAFAAAAGPDLAVLGL
jgi:predicted nucleic acid-binding protein